MEPEFPISPGRVTATDQHRAQRTKHAVSLPSLGSHQSIIRHSLKCRGPSGAHAHQNQLIQKRTPYPSAAHNSPQWLTHKEDAWCASSGPPGAGAHQLISNAQGRDAGVPGTSSSGRPC
ncbi:hypothetical protein Cadr_000023092 [Camelus dromedarius]|uniref:Uncharacterized protein n=1 Tax=Camelus dromedarius TaxID=9838 RepID=A0A5N4CIV2_CAMDR|nr:hypothetical protein Cadr_000023092 [Camelus dromedarius]